MSSYRITPTLDAMIAGVTLYQRRQLQRPPIWVVWLAACALVAFFILRSSPERLRDPVFIAVFVVLMIAFTLAFRWLFPLLMGQIYGRWQFRRTPALRRVYDLQITPDGLGFNNPGSTWVQPWSDYLDVAQNDRVMILYLSPLLIQTLPVSDLPGAARDQIAAHIRQAIGK